LCFEVLFRKSLNNLLSDLPIKNKFFEFLFIMELKRHF
jgi:hypothetical protein